MTTYKPFKCDSNYRRCNRCRVKIPYDETIQSLPPTQQPLAGWRDVRCFPSCEQAVKNRATRAEPRRAVKIPPHVESFHNQYEGTYCCVCRGVIEVGARMTSTKHDAPDGRRRWLDKRHERCKLPVRASRYAR